MSPPRISEQTKMKAARMSLGSSLRTTRESLNLSQELLAERVGKSQSWVVKMEAGKIESPSITTLRRLAQELQLDPDDLVLRLALVKRVQWNAEREALIRAQLEIMIKQGRGKRE